ncbi:putative signal transducing protein [Zobellia galactanivorans]|uniref:DUF2007 domain-containing protein n=1 Tax=Zobellia galactanivorans (strain DSM 12802 / CCUG 47099 / CIP 106680 / NCIMB 13871 / Dsij) TaxID=63186 RepID=G0L1D3_ZOBGA|nr:DUF2007 domain-containing protein [Zobellia galactanivorans]CAZ94620.1 Conserved hypothetical protein [Zobellia galactanivorans]
MNTNDVKIYSGNRFTAQLIEGKLNEVGIVPIIKDESKSARLAGFAANMDGALELYVREDEKEQAMRIAKTVSAE